MFRKIFNNKQIAGTSQGGIMTLGDNQPSGTRIGLAAVLERFPGHTAVLHQLFQGSSSFQSLCEDYRDCLAAWQYWQQEASEDAPALSQSYAELLRELEEEVRQYLELAGV
jgi:hypothetical protein